MTVTRAAVDIAALPPTPARLLPAEAVSYLLPSRYCQSDRLEGFVAREFGEFGGLRGGAMAAAPVDWTRGAIERVCVGRDATDIAVMTVFGTATFVRQRVSMVRA